MYLPLFMIGIISNTAPFWTMLIGYLLLGENVAKYEIVCIIGCFAGIVLLMIIKNADGDDTDSTAKKTSTFWAFIGIILLVIYSLSNSLTSVIIRGLKHLPASIILFYYALTL